MPTMAVGKRAAASPTDGALTLRLARWPQEAVGRPWRPFSLRATQEGRLQNERAGSLEARGKSALVQPSVLFTGEVASGWSRIELSSGGFSDSRPPNTDDPTICMKPQPESSTQEVLAGLVERVTFHNAENGFCVLRAKARGHRELVTVIGHAAIISAGEWITATGDWVNDRTHGQQFKARFLRTSAPTSADGIEKYLSSGMIRGVGPAYAKKLVRAFGEKVFDVIEAAPDRLREVDGIGVMTENPYCLARDIRGIGFKTADAIAMKLGIEKTAIVRVRAGISYAL